MVLQAVLSLACFALLGWLSGQFWFYQGLGIAISPLQTQAPAGVALLLFFLALPVFTLPLRPLMAWLSRRDEFEADAFAVDHASGTALVSALTKIYEDNAATLTPDPLHSAFYDSHPPATLRIAHIEARLAQTQPGAA
jgi:putative integral membrane zinc-metalloprotease